MRFAHTMIRVNNLQDSIKFYTNVFNMILLKTTDNPDYKYTLAFLGYKNKNEETTLELTYNWNKSQYDIGNAFGHLAFEVNNLEDICKEVEKNNGKITRKPGPIKGKMLNTIIAFVADPNGYPIELIEKQ